MGFWGFGVLGFWVFSVHPTVHLLDMLHRGGSVAVAVLVMTGDW